VKRIAKKATTVRKKAAIHRKNSTMTCGIRSSHFTSQSPRLRLGSSSPSSVTG
jgi:hypothetical protein